MLEQLGRLTYRRRWAIIAFWVAVFIPAAVLAPHVTGVLRGGGYTIGNSQSVLAYNVLHRAYGFRALTFTAVFKGEKSLLMPDARRFRRRAETAFPHQLTVTPPLYTPDRQVVFERVFSPPQSDFGAHFANSLNTFLPSGAVHGYLAGPSAIFRDMEVVSDQDLRHIELITLPIAAVVLLFIFGSLGAAIVPVLMAPIAVTLTLALVYLIGRSIDMSIFVLNIASMLGLAVAIDYSLLMVNRFREEIAAGSDLESAVGRSVATAGRAILVSALVVSAGFYGLTLAGVSMLASVGIGGSLVTAISLLVALSFLPAVLGILGARINKFSVVPRRLTSRNLWHELALFVMRRPWQIVVSVTVVTVILAVPALHLRVGIPGPEILPPSVESRAGNDILQRHLGLANQPPVLVVVQRRPGTPVATARSAAFTALDRICSSAFVGGVSSVAVANSPNQIQSCQAALDGILHSTRAQREKLRRLAATETVALISAFLTANPSSAAAERYVESLRRHLAISGYRVMVGGQTAGQLDFDNYLYSRFPLVALAVIAIIFLVLLVAFRSLLLPLKAVLMNLFSIVAAYGAVTFAFQDGRLSSLLNFTPVGNIDSIVPVFLFCALFGVSTDYEVFLLSRVQEEYRQTGNNEQSVARGLEVTGRIITSAAAVMFVVFSAFAFARLVVVKEVGLGAAVAVLVDATLIRALLVPATMRLLGRWNWWFPGSRIEPATSGKTEAAR